MTKYLSVIHLTAMISPTGLKARMTSSSVTSSLYTSVRYFNDNKQGGNRRQQRTRLPIKMVWESGPRPGGAPLAYIVLESAADVEEE